MIERLNRYYSKEEEFVVQHYMSAFAAADFMKGAWLLQPEIAEREMRQHASTKNDSDRLFFEGAAVYHTTEGFSSVHIVLKSTNRKVAIRVKPQGREFVAEKITDTDQG